MDRGFYLIDFTTGILCGWLAVFGYDIQTFNQRAVIGNEHFEYFSGFPFVISGNNLYGISFFDMQFNF
jgi:hypothetical protein